MENLIELLVKKGVGIRLTEINAERERLNDFLNNPARHTPRVHWTRRPENRTKVLNARLRAALTRRTRRGRLL